MPYESISVQMDGFLEHLHAGFELSLNGLAQQFAGMAAVGFDRVDHL